MSTEITTIQLDFEPTHLDDTEVSKNRPWDLLASIRQTAETMTDMTRGQSIIGDQTSEGATMIIKAADNVTELTDALLLVDSARAVVSDDDHTDEQVAGIGRFEEGHGKLPDGVMADLAYGDAANVVLWHLKKAFTATVN